METFTPTMQLVVGEEVVQESGNVTHVHATARAQKKSKTQKPPDYGMEVLAVPTGQLVAN